VLVIAKDGAAINGNGGAVTLRMGVPSGSGSKGRLTLTNTAGTYSDVASLGVVTPGLGPGVGVTLTRWVPVTVDGVTGWFAFYA
jgi:hypothetical protein